MPPSHHGSAKTCAHRQYRMTCEEFEELWARAGGRCELCRVAPEATSYGRLVIDHDPMIGIYAVRGLLCNTCNSGLHLASMAGADRNAYLARPWHARSGLRRARRRAVALKVMLRGRLLAELDSATAEYRATKARRDAARARLKAARAQ